MEKLSLRDQLLDFNASYTRCIDSDSLESWPGFFASECHYRVTSAENDRDGHQAGLMYATSRAMLEDRISALRHANATLLDCQFMTEHLRSMGAVELAQAGLPVALLDAAPQAGGRARRVDLPLGDRCYPLDNGQHLLIGAYTATAALMSQVGVALDTAFTRRPFEIVNGFRAVAVPPRRRGARAGRGRARRCRG